MIGELAGYVGLLLFAPAIWAARALARRHSDIRWRLACWWADHKYAKLRATTSPACDVPEVALGSTAPSGEPQPAPLLSTRGAGTNPMTGGSAVMIGVEPPQPAPGRVRPGAGPTPPARPMASDTCPDHLPQAGREEVTTAPPPISGADGDRRDVDTSPRASVSASPHQRSAAACPPEQAAAGLPPRPGATPGGAGPSVVAADGPARAVA
jgi:hypothetical protein